MPLNYPVLFKDMDASDNANIQQAIQTAITDAESLWSPEKFDGVFPTRGFGIKRLQLKDLAHLSAYVRGNPYSDQGSWFFSINTAYAWESIINNAVLSDSCYVILTGFFNYDAAPDVEVIKIIADGIEYPPIDIMEMYGWDVATAYFSHPIIIRPEKMVTIKVKCEAAGIKHFGFLGFTIAKRSYLIGEV